jgi:DNA-binding MurR/RpiR family transcriptional regulator/dienelactone hydrolase
MAILEQPPVPGQRSGVLERIQVALSTLPPAERRIGERILADPAQAIALSISEFAALCEVGQTTVSKFCRSIGISSYAALRLGLSHDFATQQALKKSNIPLADALVSAITAVSTLFGSHADLPAITQALLMASHVEIWAGSDFSAAGAQLADRLMSLGIQTTIAPVSARWSQRCAGLRAGSLVVLLTTSSEEVLLAPLARAQRAGARLLVCSSQSSRRLGEVVDWLLPLPTAPSTELVGFALVEVLIASVQEAAGLPGPAGPASPWQPWPHSRSLFLPTETDPIPAVLLAHEDPPQARPLILYFTGMGISKEQALPGFGGTFNPICPRIIASLLNAGYHVLVIDALAHGARKRAWQDPYILIFESLSGKGEDVLAGARVDAPFLVDAVPGLGLSNGTPPLGIVGQSWGGLQSLLTLASDSRIACGVGIMPIIHIAHLSNFAALEGAARVEAGQPGAWMGPTLAPRPLLLISGELDQVAPTRHAQAFVDSICPAYRAAGAGERLQCTVLPGVGHYYHPRMIEETLAWLGRYLPTPPGESAS